MRGGAGQDWDLLCSPGGAQAQGGDEEKGWPRPLGLLGWEGGSQALSHPCAFPRRDRARPRATLWHGLAVTLPPPAPSLLLFYFRSRGAL